ncbi:High affinity cAMP-specific and IBMX-insensitive 3',5'-cyclic phosphodiesterase 9A, partial [Rhizophlyctis rosea]
MTTPTPVHISIQLPNTPPRNETIHISPSMTVAQVRSLLCAAAEVNDSSRDVVVKLYDAKGEGLIPIGPSIVGNGSAEGERLRLVVKRATYIPDKPEEVKKVVDELNAVASVIQNVQQIKQRVDDIKQEAEEIQHGGLTHTPADDISHHSSTRPAIRRVRQVANLGIESPLIHNFSPSTIENLKHPTFDVWQWEDSEMVGLVESMYEDFGLIEHFAIEREKLHRFLQCARSSYNQNPFHNFRHCFCVTQMMYGLLYVTGVHEKLNKLEKLVLLTACIGHDLDHPGFNNAYQINANTELAIIYNDVSPLENHHSAVLFTILKSPETNILSNLSDADYKEVRKKIIECVLATDMAKHGEILARFKGFAEQGWSFEDPVQRGL